MRRRLQRFWGLAVLAALMTGGAILPASAAGQTASGTPIDMPKLSIEALAWLQGLIRINTTNPPGNELAAAKYVAGILDKEGIQSQIIETTPGRALGRAFACWASAGPFAGAAADGASGRRRR